MSRSPRPRTRRTRPPRRRRWLVAGLIVVVAGTGATIAVGAAVSQRLNSPALASQVADRVAPPAAPTTTPISVPTSPPPAACASGGAYLWANLETCGWAGPANTGVPAGVSLTPTSGRTIRVDNTVVDGERISGSLTIAAKNVVVRNTVIDYAGSGGGGSGGIKVLAGATATIDHVEVDGNSAVHACVWHEGAGVTIDALDCHDVEDGVFAWADTGTPSSGDDLTLSNSYVHDLNATESNGHHDGFQTEGAARLTIRHNTFDMTATANAAISIWNSQKDTATVVIDANLVTGGGFSVYAQDYSPSEANPSGGFGMTGVVATGNRFSTRASGCVGTWGVWFFRSSWTYQGGPTGGWGANGNVRSGNVVLESGLSLDAGNPPGCT